MNKMVYHIYCSLKVDNTMNPKSIKVYIYSEYEKSKWQPAHLYFRSETKVCEILKDLSIQIADFMLNK